MKLHHSKTLSVSCEVQIYSETNKTTKLSNVKTEVQISLTKFKIMLIYQTYIKS